jgi:hypothetical protein
MQEINKSSPVFQPNAELTLRVTRYIEKTLKKAHIPEEKIVFKNASNLNARKLLKLILKMAL